MKQGKITTIIIIYYLLSIIYEIFYPAFPGSVKPWYYVFWYCFYYFLSYGLTFSLAYGFYKKVNYRTDSMALFTILFYSGGKFIYYIFLINQDFPTYIKCLNSKPVSIAISFILWSLSIIIWTKKYNIRKLLKLKK